MAPRLATSAGPRRPFDPVPPHPLAFVALSSGELHALARIILTEAAGARADGDIAAADRLTRRAADLVEAAR